MKGSSIPFKKNMIQGVSIVLAAFVLGLMLVCAVRTLKSFDDTVKVRGLCEKEVPVDVIEELLKEEDDAEETLKKRPPVVCVMGHGDRAAEQQHYCQQTA